MHIFYVYIINFKYTDSFLPEYFLHCAVSLPLMSSMENTSVIYKVNDAAVHVGRLRLKETPGFPAIAR